MVFFVFYGKVQVDVAGTVFRIGKGGVWQVPRGQSFSPPFVFLLSLPLSSELHPLGPLLCAAIQPALPMHGAGSRCEVQLRVRAEHPVLSPRLLCSERQVHATSHKHSIRPNAPFQS